MFKKKRESSRDLPGGPVATTPRSHCRGRRLDPWSGSYNSTCLVAQPKEKHQRQQQKSYSPALAPREGAKKPLML